MEGKEIPDGEFCDWETLSGKRGAELESFYSQLLRSLSTEKGMLGHIFTKSQNKIQDPAKLLRVINIIDQEQWSLMYYIQYQRFIRNPETIIYYTLHQPTLYTLKV